MTRFQIRFATVLESKSHVSRLLRRALGYCIILCELQYNAKDEQTDAKMPWHTQVQRTYMYIDKTGRVCVAWSAVVRKLLYITVQ